MSLDRYSTQALLAELQRRERVEAAQPRFVSCEACRNFKAQPGSDTANPCQRGHTMRFVMPEDHNWPESDAWGFTRSNCKDLDMPPDPVESGSRSRPDAPPKLRKV